MKKVRGLGLTKRYPGRLFVVEGCDGSGKTTQLYLLRRWLESLGYSPFFTEWNSSELLRKTTKKAKKERALTPTTFSLIHAADFADRYEKYILPHLRAGHIVLADRYIYTAYARDVARGCDPAWVRNVYGFAVRPTVTFYFQTPLDLAVSRILSGRTQLKYHEAGMDLGLSCDPVQSFRLFQGRIMDGYDAMAREEGFVIIDGSLPIEAQQDHVRRVVSRSLRDFVLPPHVPSDPVKPYGGLAMAEREAAAEVDRP